MIITNMPKLFITLFLIGVLSVITSCTRPGQPTGGAGPTEQDQMQTQQNQTCPVEESGDTGTEAGGTGTGNGY
ncbi:MAG: hypothetical protein A2104_09030 [Candidatus Melainabacteria bacterium GWF2_32_7]|nr:MAG: hypothetical protein A2104_09030 [Candidatus Melainabacteria bacterium GWF2_32_7]